MSFSYHESLKAFQHPQAAARSHRRIQDAFAIGRQAEVRAGIGVSPGYEVPGKFADVLHPHRREIERKQTPPPPAPAGFRKGGWKLWKMSFRWHRLRPEHARFGRPKRSNSNPCRLDGRGILIHCPSGDDGGRAFPNVCAHQDGFGLPSRLGDHHAKGRRKNNFTDSVESCSSIWEVFCQG